MRMLMRTIEKMRNGKSSMSSKRSTKEVIMVIALTVIC